MYKKIIVEGVDGAGKTTYIKKIIEDNPDVNYEVIHCTRHTDNNIDFFMDVLTSDKNIILDRSYVGQFVYNNDETRSHNKWLSLEDLQLIEETIIVQQKLGVLKAVYVYSDTDVCLFNCRKDVEDNYYTFEYIQDLQRRYEYFFDHISSVEFKKYYNDYHPADMDDKDKTDLSSINYGSFDYKSLPKVVAVDFDGTLVPDDFPNIGKLNEKLVYELLHGKYKDYKKVLYTHRSGQYLIDACNFCAQNGIYFDAVNDDVPEVKKALNRNPVDHRKVWFDVMIDDKMDSVDNYK